MYSHAINNKQIEPYGKLMYGQVTTGFIYLFQKVRREKEAILNLGWTEQRKMTTTQRHFYITY